jgi:hypothetical protein
VTERVYLHVGGPKSGTTYLQGVLDLNRERLARAGVLVVGERHLDRVHAGLVVREDPRVAGLPERGRGAWDRLVAQIRDWTGDTAVLSYELLSAASAEQAERALADLDGLDVHVVVTSRDLGLAVASAWQERLKFALTTPLEQWRPRSEAEGPRAEWGWRTMDPAGVAARWGRTLPPDHVHIVTVPRPPAPPELLWSRYARACGISVTGLDLQPPRSNQSLGVVAAALLRRVNQHVTEPVTSSREQATWLRDVLAHRVLAGLDAEPIGVTDAQFEEAARQSRASIAALSAAGYDVVGDLDDIRATRRAARTPQQVPDSELVDLAARAIFELVVALREASGPPPDPEPAPPPPPAAPGLRGRASRWAADLVTARVRNDLDAMEQRLTVLEAQLRESRRTNIRLAMLSDLVTELLLPMPARDESAVTALLSAYRTESL